MTTIVTLLEKNALITAFVVVALILAFSNWLATRLFRGQIHGSAIAITLGLILAYWGGLVAEGAKAWLTSACFLGLGYWVARCFVTLPLWPPPSALSWMP